MKELFSINRAAGLLERDRATLTRALRSIKPDGFDRGQPRWFLPTIVNALAVPPQQRRDSGKARDRFSLRNKELDELQVTIERQIELIASEPSPDRRRAMAIELAPQLAEHHVFARVVELCAGSEAEVLECGDACGSPRRSRGAGTWPASPTAAGQARAGPSTVGSR